MILFFSDNGPVFDIDPFGAVVVPDLLNAKGNNLKNISINIPLGCFVSITGVSGSGKSTLINQTLYPILAQKFFSNRLKPLNYSEIKGVAYLDKVVNITQSPIGKTPRSNPATYTGVFGHIRELYSQLPDAKVMGYKLSLIHI